MRNTSEMTELLIHEKALAMHNLAVKKDRTPEEVETLRILAQDLLSTLPPAVTDDFDDDNGFEPNAQSLADNSDENVVSRSTGTAPAGRKSATVAAALSTLAKPPVVPLKEVINQAYPGENIGSQHTPVIKRERFFSSHVNVSPHGGTLTLEQTVTVKVQKRSGGSFIIPTSEDIVAPEKNSPPL